MTRPRANVGGMECSSLKNLFSRDIGLRAPLPKELNTGLSSSTKANSQTTRSMALEGVVGSMVRSTWGNGPMDSGTVKASGNLGTETKVIQANGIMVKYVAMDNISKRTSIPTKVISWLLKRMVKAFKSSTIVILMMEITKMDYHMDLEGINGNAVSFMKAVSKKALDKEKENFIKNIFLALMVTLKMKNHMESVDFNLLMGMFSMESLYMALNMVLELYIKLTITFKFRDFGITISCSLRLTTRLAQR